MEFIQTALKSKSTLLPHNPIIYQLTFWVILLISQNSFANNDQLFNTYKKTTGLEKVKALHELFLEDYQKLTVKDFQDAIRITQKEKEVSWEGVLLSDLGAFVSYQGEFENAIEYLYQAKPLIDVREFAYDYFYLLCGLVDFHLALQQYEEAITINEELLIFSNDDTEYKAIAYYMLASIYFDLNAYDKSLIYVHQALSFKAEKLETQGSNHNLLGSIFLQLDNLDSALYHYNCAYDLLKNSEEEQKSSHYLPSILANISSVYYDLGDYQKAKNAAEEGLRIVWEDDIVSVTLLKQELSRYLYQQKAYNEARDTLATTQAYLEELNDFDLWHHHYELLRDIEREQNNHLQAWKYNKLYKNYSDSIYNLQKETQLLGLKAQYDIEKKDIEINALKVKNKAQSRVMIMSIVTVILLLGVVVSIIRQYRLQSAARRQKIKYLEAKEQQQKVEIERIEAEKKIETLERERLKEKVAFTNRALASNTTYLLKKSEQINAIKKQIEQITGNVPSRTQRQLKDIVQSIDQSLNLDSDWETFKVHFEQVNPDFFKKLEEKHQLNTNDLRLCAYIKMKLTNKEIARMMNINTQSVITARYRLKKKLGIDMDMNSYINEM